MERNCSEDERKRKKIMERNDLFHEKEITYFMSFVTRTVNILVICNIYENFSFVYKVFIYFFSQLINGRTIKPLFLMKKLVNLKNNVHSNYQ